MGTRLLPVLVALALLVDERVATAGDYDLGELSLEELLEVEVRTASFVLDQRTEQPVSMTTITREDIAGSGARTLNELLTLHVPGFFTVEDQDDTIAAFRGFAPDNNTKVLLLIDGRPVNAEWFVGPPDAILNGIDLGWIERVEVIRGPGSATLGQGALLGVVNVITASDAEEPYARFSTSLGTGRLLVGRLEAGATSRAYPEHVSRLNVRGRPCARCWVTASLVRFSRWFTPSSSGGVADGAGHAWLDLAAGYRWGHLTASGTVKNLTDTGGLWPMNSNASDPSVSPGTPALESRQLWITVGATF